MTSNKQISLEASAILAKAVEWHLIARLWEPPQQRSLAELGCLSSQIHDQLLGEAAGLAGETTQENYLKHFGPDAPVPLQETKYTVGRDPQEILSHIKIDYEASSFQSLKANPSDHIAVEADFISHLYVREARARIANDGQLATAALDLRKKFVEEHFGPLVNNVSLKMSGSEPALFLKLIGATILKLQDYRSSNR